MNIIKQALHEANVVLSMMIPEWSSLLLEDQRADFLKSVRSTLVKIDEAQAVLSNQAPGADEATYKVGRWLSTALDDPQVCDEMKADILAWMDAGCPNVQAPCSVFIHPTTNREATMSDALKQGDDK